MSDFPSSKYERGKIFAKTGARLGTNYARHHLEQKLGKKKTAAETSAFHTRNAEAMYEEFTKLRGAALKMAQAMSIDQSFMPEEFAEVLAQAQYQVPPISASLVRSIIKKELGAYPENIFESFEPKAFAAASLGQVHRATLKNGQQLAVKIQYPNVRETLESDLTMGKVVFRQVSGKEAADKYFGEIKEKLLEETDYQLEGENIQMYGERYDHPDFVTPSWLPEYSTQRVLTMTYLEGKHLNEFLKDHPDQELKNKYGQLLWDFFHSQVNEHHTVHADSHPGNFVLTPDHRLGILDFGCIKKCPADFFNSFLSLMPAHLDGNEKQKLNVYYDLEILYDDPKASKKEREFYAFCKDFGNLMIRPYENDIFDFSDREYDERMIKLLRDAAAGGTPRGSRHFVYIARVVIGLYRMLIQLEAQINTANARGTIADYLESQNISAAESKR